MASNSGLTQRRRNVAADSNDDLRSSTATGGENVGERRDSRRSVDEDDDDDDGKGMRSKSNKMNILEEVVLLGLKDAQGYLSFWNDNISYVSSPWCDIDGTFFPESGNCCQGSKKKTLRRTFSRVVDDKNTGEVLLDETLKLIKTDTQSISAWIDLLSGETWNLMKIGYQLKQVRERIQKGLVDKGVLRTEKRSFVLFEMATHPVADYTIKEQLIQRVVDTLLNRGPPPDRRTIAMVCAAYAANVLENALTGLSHAQREAAFLRVDELLQEFAGHTEKARGMGCTEIMAGVLSVYTKMDSLL
ncbi:Golgi phosphoprotein 3-domain-containing protein [Chytridium lagenaria]|nr:Golgi phosphoprotein 3-domain-containing protein [Chytridium lagenaria]